MGRKVWFLLFAGLTLISMQAASSAQGTSGVFRLDGRIVLNAFRGLVEEQLGSVLGGLKALAATQDAMSGDWKHIKTPLARFSANVSTDAAMWFAKPDGSYFKVGSGEVAQNLKDRDYFPTLLAGKDVEGNLVISKSTGARSVIVATPVIKDDQVIGALGASVSLEKLSRFVQTHLGIPHNVIFYALDAHGKTVLHSTGNLIFEFPSDVGDASLKSAVKRMLAKEEGFERYTFQGQHRTVLFEKSPTTGWVFALGITHGGSRDAAH